MEKIEFIVRVLTTAHLVVGWLADCERQAYLRGNDRVRPTA